MSLPAGTDAKLQIGHVLFIDIVGYSKLLVDEQAAAVRHLNEVVQATDEFRSAGRKNKLVRIPTGDGMALVFRDSPESPVRCAHAISKSLRQQSRPLQVRMGIHSGLVRAITDVNNRLNVAGAGINFAQRVMDCGDAGHILLSKHVAEDLEHHARWQPLLHELGPCEVKHGVQVGLVNFYDAEAGNPDLPVTIRRLRKRQRTGSAFLFASTGALGLIVAVGSWFVLTRYAKTDRPSQIVHTETSPVTATPETTPTDSASPGLNFAHTAAIDATWPAQPKFMAASPSEKLFAGTWRGTIRNAGPRGTKTSQIEFTIDEAENHWSNMGSGTSSRHGRTLTYTRSYRLGRTSVRQTADLTVNEDGRTASYKSSQTSVTGKVRSSTSGFGTLEKTD